MGGPKCWESKKIQEWITCEIPIQAKCERDGASGQEYSNSRGHDRLAQEGNEPKAVSVVDHDRAVGEQEG